MFNLFPYTDFHELNLDWILGEIRKLHKDYDEFKVLNTITFSGAWDITKQYPAWTIVNVNDTTGYISLKPVPAGIDYTNTDYWVLIADYTVTLAEIQNRVTALENAVAPLTAEYNLEHNRKILFVGDSYSSTSYWTHKTGLLFGLVQNVSYFVNAVGGESFTTGVDNNGYLYELQQFDADDNVPNDEITDIIICGGANDAYGDNPDIDSHMQDFMLFARAHFPNATIYLGFIGAIINGGSQVGPRTQAKLRYACYAYSTITKYGGRFLAGMEYVLHKLPGMLDSGGLHPTMSAGDNLARAIYNSVNGFNAIDEWVDMDVVLTPLIAGDTQKTIKRTNAGQTVTLTIPGDRLDIDSTAVTTYLPTGNGTAVYKLSGIYFNYKHVVSGVTAAAIGDYTGSVDIIFEGDTMYVRSNKAPNVSFLSMDTTKLIIRNFELTVSTLDVM